MSPFDPLKTSGVFRGMKRGYWEEKSYDIRKVEIVFKKKTVINEEKKV